MKKSIETNYGTFTYENVTAQRTSRYGHYSISAIIDGVKYSSYMDTSYLYDDMYRDVETEEDLEAQELAEKQVANIIINDNIDIINENAA